MSDSTPRIGIIVGSTRPVRIGRQLADATATVIAEATGAQVEILDLAEIALPLLDEPFMPAMGKYQHDHTIAWVERIANLDGVIFLTPQYNGGYPAALKNAIDYVYAEWKQKPAAIMSYGGHGGRAAAKQLREVLDFIGLSVTDEQVALTIEQSDYTPELNLGDASGVVARDAEAIAALGTALVARVGELVSA